MKPGIRLQLGLALAGLFVLGFVPLFFAVASLGRATLRAEREKSARLIGRVVAARVAEAQSTRTPGELLALMEAQVGSASGLYGIATYDVDGAALVRAGDPETALAMPPRVTPGNESVRSIATRHGPALEVIVPGSRGAVVAVLRTDEEVARSGPLVRLVGLYTLAIGAALLVFVYFALTRLVVRPLDALSRAARRVADGGQHLERVHAGSAELIDLEASFAETTERLRAEERALRGNVEELERATDELKNAQTQLVASERLASVGRLAAGLAHEIGNPLAAIMGLQDLLIEGGLEREEEHDFTLRMRKETERIHRILRDLLDYARPTALQTPDRPDEPGSIDRAIGDVVNLLRPQKTMRDVELALDLEDDLPPVALSHEHLTQVVLNLVGNAAESTGEGGHVALRARAVSGGVELSVEDNGPGIEASVASTLFEPFVTTKEVGKGTGLGLAVCRGLIEGAGGTITAGPRADGERGARFVASIPLAGAPSSRPSARARADVRRDGNHLVGQPSPYLEQHSHNPVEWYPWGEEALEKARREQKPIFLSIGYATCHWCHVMESESFTDDEIARVLNARFVAIKVDREERPDLDAVYLEAVSALGGSTGWPLNVFLTPALEPYFGGTYFGRASAHGRPSFLEVLREMDRLWTHEGRKVAARGREILGEIGKRGRASEGEISELTLNQAMDRLERARDTELGGFGTRQKFPNAPLLLAELRFARRTGGASARAHVEQTLAAMAEGGIYDHLAGTFHRYSTDRRWHVPHFEKTLYDNAQLASLYAEESVVTEGYALAPVAPRILDELAAHWQTEDGGLVVGFDADDTRGEGTFYTWTPAELGAALGPEAGARAQATLGVSAAGEPGLDGRSVLHFDSLRAAAEGERLLPLLRAARDARPPPAVDDKELAGWNGLALAAFADVGRYLGEPRYVAVAQRIARYLTARCWAPKDGLLARGFRRGVRLGDGFLEDYALVALGLIKLHAADGDGAWLLHARAIGDALLRRFHDPTRATFFRAEHGDAAVPTRTADVIDGPLPAGGSAAALLFLELGALAGDARLREIGARALAAQSSLVVASPTQSGFFLVAIDHATAGVREVVVAGEERDPRTRALVAELARTTDARVLPVRVPAAGADPELTAAFPALDGKVAQKGVPTAYVCDRGACQRPTSDPEKLRAQLPR